MAFFDKQCASRLGRSIVTAIATAQTNASQLTTPVGSQTYEVRLVSTLPIWATFNSTTATANSDNLIPANVWEYFIVKPNSPLAFISTSTSTGYVCLTEMS
jgi:hypothetical protein